MHQIEYWIFPCKKTPKGIQREVDRYCKEHGDYHHACDPIRFSSEIMDNVTEARTWIDCHDRGFYDCLAVKYKDGRKIDWLVKFEFHV